MSLLAVTVISRDRVALIADVTGVLADLGGNLEDSSMTLLHGHFAWTLLLRVDSTAGEVRARLAPVCPDGVAVSDVDDLAAEAAPAMDRLVVAVHGSDRVGIVAAVARVIADFGGNITELTTRLGSPRTGGSLYLAVAEVEFPIASDLDGLRDALAARCHELQLDVTVHRAEPDLM